MKPIFSDPNLKKQIFKLFVPFLIQELVATLTTLMSNIILNLWHCEAAVTTAVSYVFQIFFFCCIIESSVCQIANLFISQHYGRGDIANVEKVYHIVLKISIAVGLIFFTLALAIPEQIFFFDNNPVSRHYAVEYIRWYSPVFLLVGPLMINYALMKNTHLEKFSMISSVATFIFVSLVESVAIFSLDEAHYHLALELAASSIVFVRSIEFVFTFIVIKKKCVAKFRFKEFFTIDVKRSKKIAYYGAPMMISKISWGVGSLFTTAFTSLFLTDSIIIAHSLMVNYANVVACITNAISFAVVVLIGRELGANRLRKAKSHARDISRLLMIMSLIEMACLMLFLPIVIATTASDTLKSVDSFIWKVFLVRLIVIIPSTYNAAYTKGLFNAGGDTLYIMLVDGICAWTTIVPLAFIGLQFKWDPLLIYIFLQFEEVFKFPLNVWRYKQKKWVNNITNKKGIVFN